MEMHSLSSESDCIDINKKNEDKFRDIFSSRTGNDIHLNGNISIETGHCKVVRH